MLFLIGSKRFEEYSSECVVNGNGVMYGYGKRMAEKFPVRVQKGKRICMYAYVVFSSNKDAIRRSLHRDD